jgi:hypothetical protein
VNSVPQAQRVVKKTNTHSHICHLWVNEYDLIDNNLQPTTNN